MTSSTTVAGYLAQRLVELGLDRMYGVAGNYTAAFLDTILSDPDSPIAITGSPNEICAGFAADGHARLTGFGALYVTYSVGAFTLLNTIAGSYVERVPVLLVNGAPTNKETSIEDNAALLYSHTTGFDLLDIHVFRSVTAACERITDGRRAPYQVDSVLTAMLTEHRPGYLEVTEDVWRATCPAPVGELGSGLRDRVTVDETDQAVHATMQLVRDRPRLVLWAGIELQRFGLEQAFLDLLDTIDAATGEADVGFVTTSMSKSVLSEDHPRFRGCVTLRNAEIQELVGDDGCILGLGGWTTSKDTGSENIRGPGTILAANGNVVVGAGLFPLVELGDYLAGLTAAFAAEAAPAPRPLHGPSLTALTPSVPDPEPEPDTELTYDGFFAALDDWLDPDDVLVVDSGFPLIGAQPLHVARRGGFVAQAAWLSIGWSVPAATGVKFADPDRRPIVVVGDGAFHETCQAVSDHTANGHDTIVFVLANGLYGIEQFLVNPNPFRGAGRVTYPDPLQNTPYPYNDLPDWDLVSLARGFGAEGRRVATVGELATVLAELRDLPDRNVVVEVRLPEVDLPEALARVADASVGEDETDNPGWPPAGVF